ncbi:MAG: UDP-galactose-lipid carrier transferase [Leptospiraceae bacterium]|nr:UDP-galactose-lipid carrier transferase [Leptospiraceae bacterium]
MSFKDPLDLDLAQSVSADRYHHELKSLQKELVKAALRMYKKKASVVLAFEGKDAAGKGGAIRRLTSPIPPMLYRVIPIAAPEPFEKKHHYLWRFWRQLPPAGRMAIFDRSWYGRVLVERVEGFATEEEWSRAYQEINSMELNLHRSGIKVAKFWLHIDQKEQEARFEARALSPLKQWKFTEEDVRNRDKWPQYEEAVREMLIKTHHDYAPWHLIEANDKRFARIKVLRTVLSLLNEI